MTAADLGAVVWEAPGRVNLIGEHTDYNDGFVLPLALPHTTRVTATRRPGPGLRLVSDGATQGWTAYPEGVLAVLREAGHQVGGADLAFTSTVPTGAGLSSSAALEVATAAALNDLYGLGLTRPELARVCQAAENVHVGVPCGVMDQMASACCTAGHALHLDTRDLAVRAVPFDLTTAGLRLLVVDTRVKHALTDGAYAERRAGCERAARALGVPALRDVAPEGLDETLERLRRAVDDPRLPRLVRHVVTENARVAEVVGLLDAGRPRDVGPVLTAGHASLRDDYAVSCPELDLAVAAANAAGALGARMTGGGFGGSAVVLVEQDATAEVGDAVTAAFARAGHRPPRLFEAVPSAGVRRVSPAP
ncbi:galactokinase family protein [Streptomyces sp. TRM 70351]|uniref:galactokinase n=1 Tax=Streptomyces sp. TRM 70351 TaxID=3116552 RepID=UPI002E7B5CBC|nr:galactokinase family protein [Streptomyces sp. TRM 70351]MEE1929452.1 galactokinase family protein [Streptomyces sp. TRM 70351]